MKTMFLTLAAALGIVLGTASLIQAAHASSIHLNPPAEGSR
jgi:hypothetical protein